MNQPWMYGGTFYAFDELKLLTIKLYCNIQRYIVKVKMKSQLFCTTKDMQENQERLIRQIRV